MKLSTIGKKTDGKMHLEEKMKQSKQNHMDYFDGMEKIDSDIMEQVFSEYETFNYDKYTKQHIINALNKDQLSKKDFAALLSPSAEFYLEEMASAAKEKTKSYFGNAVAMFTPLYIANYCENHCTYCGFNCKNKIKRAKLTEEEIEIEMKTIAKTGLREILILTGECRNTSNVDYIGKAIKIAKKYFSTIGIEVYPMNTNEYKYLQECGADFVSVYQETYNTEKYQQVHPKGPKRSFPYRFNAQERALQGGMRGVAFGSLLGLSNFRKDAFAAGIHAYLIQRKYPTAEISFSFPRLRPYIHNTTNGPNDVGERQLLQVMLAYRLFMPYTGITISTRERSGFRDNVAGMVATKISAGVKVGVGGHEEEAKGDEQFEISDGRSVEQVRNVLVSKGLQPVFTDYIRV